MAYERTGLGTAVTDPSSLCPVGQRMEFAGTRSERCVPMQQAQAVQPPCSSYACPTGQNKIDQAFSYVGAAGQTSLEARRALVARGCTIAQCSQGAQLVDGSGHTTYCCPPQATTTTTPAVPSSPTALVPGLQQPSPASHRIGELMMVAQLVVFHPLFWLAAAGIGGVALFRWWSNRSK
jgi:hypothetical protein